MFDGEYPITPDVEISWSRPPAIGVAGLQARRRKAADHARKVGPIAADLRKRGLSLRQIAAALVNQGVRTRRDAAWTAASVRALLQTFEAADG